MAEIMTFPLERAQNRLPVLPLRQQVIEFIPFLRRLRAGQCCPRRCMMFDCVGRKACYHCDFNRRKR